MSPPVSWRFFSSDGAIERLLAGALEPLLVAVEQPEDEEAGEHEPEGQREAEERGRSRLGHDPAPGRRLEHADHEEREPGRRDHDADEVEVRAMRDRRVGGAPRQQEDGDVDDDLAGEDVAPGEVGGHEAADHRPDGDGDRRRGEDEAVGLGPRRGREVAGHEGDDGRHDEHGADALEERPADDQHREVGRDRRGRRAAAVDDAADREGALEADDAADLAAQHHEAGHDQRVEGDRRLDAGDRGADVLGDGGDGDVHHRHVEGHEELAGGEREEDEAGAGGRRGGRLRPRCALSSHHSPLHGLPTVR